MHTFQHTYAQRRAYINTDITCIVETQMELRRMHIYLARILFARPQAGVEYDNKGTTNEQDLRSDLFQSRVERSQKKRAITMEAQKAGQSNNTFPHTHNHTIKPCTLASPCRHRP
jgi:hypothetical protein